MSAPTKRRVSKRRVARVWQGVAREVYDARVCADMPKWVMQLAATFWDPELTLIAKAVREGDPAFFLAYLVRLDQIDRALIADGRGLAERAPVIRARSVIVGLQDAAVASLEAQGGIWPYSSPSRDPEGPPDESED